jgi:hypothetical protein
MSQTKDEKQRTRLGLIAGIVLVMVVGLGISAALKLSSPANTDTSAVHERLYQSCRASHLSANPEIGQNILTSTCTQWTDETFARREADVLDCDRLSQTADEFVICLLGRLIQPLVGWR